VIVDFWMEGVFEGLGILKCFPLNLQVLLIRGETVETNECQMFYIQC